MLYVTRHGQTDYNAEMRFQGRLDIPLNNVGRQQAKQNGQVLRELLGDAATDFDFVSSPMIRARQTMEIVRSQISDDLPAYRTDDRLIEVSFGDWEGSTLKELEKEAPALFAERERDKWYFTPPGERAESYEDITTRVDDFLSSIDRPTLCICHGGIIRAMFRLVGKLDGLSAATALIPQDKVLKINQGEIGWL